MTSSLWIVRHERDLPWGGVEHEDTRVDAATTQEAIDKATTPELVEAGWRVRGYWLASALGGQDR